MKKIIKRLRTDFIAGIAVTLPAIVTIMIIRFLVSATNNAVLAPLTGILEPYLRDSSILLAKVLIFIGVIVVIIVAGAGTRVLVLRQAFSFGEGFLYRLPLISRIYKATKQMSAAFVGEGKNIFKSVVAVEYPRQGMYSIGFVTFESRKNIDEKIGKSTISVFVPTTPNPTSGMLVMVPKEQVIYLNMSVEDGMKLVISGGAVTLE